MLTNDNLRDLAALVDLDPDCLNAPDDQLVTLVWHEILARHEAGTATEVFRAMPHTLFCAFFADPRILRHMCDAAPHLGVTTTEPSNEDAPDTSREAWVREVVEGDTDLGYEEWAGSFEE